MFPNCHFLLFQDDYQSFNLEGKLRGKLGGILFGYWHMNQKPPQLSSKIGSTRPASSNALSTRQIVK